MLMSNNTTFYNVLFDMSARKGGVNYTIKAHDTEYTVRATKKKKNGITSW